jgi:signal transduction histidine kinase
MVDKQKFPQGMSIETLQVLLSISQQMAQTRALDPLLKYALEQAVQLVKAQAGYIILKRQGLPSEHPNALDFRVGYGVSEDVQPLQQISKTILYEVLNTGHPKISDQINQESPTPSVLELDLRSVMCMPLISQGSILGAIYIWSRGFASMFEKEHITAMILFANQAAVAVQNAILNDDLEQRIEARTEELAQANAFLEASWQQAVQANHLVNTWLVYIAHDLRSPLAVVLAVMEAIYQKQVTTLDDIHFFVERALESTKRVLALVNDIFDLVKMDEGGLRLKPMKTNLAEYLGRVYSYGRTILWAPEVVFRLHLDEHLPVMRFDPDRIEQVLLNLMYNAARYTPHGEVVLYAKHAPQAGYVIIGVRDTGEGVSPEVADKIFERFIQASENSDKRRQGSGLGLAICRSLVEMHGGKIWVESVAGQGADFKFILPVEEGT